MGLDKAIGAAMTTVQNAGTRLLAAATNTTRYADPDATAVEAKNGELVETGRPVDLVKDIVDIKSAKIETEASMSVIRNSLDTEKKLLDILG